MLKSEKTSKLILSLTVTALALGLLAGPAAALKPHVRDGWLVGVSFGYSQGHIDWAADTKGSYEGGAVPQIRIARMLNPKLALGLEYHGWMLETGGSTVVNNKLFPLKIRSSLQSATLAATWFPGRPDTPWEGLYLRGGVGYGWAGFTIVEIDLDPPEHVPLDQEHGTRKDESGLGFNLQVGYEWRVSRSMAAGLGVGLDYLSINDDIYKSSYYFPITLTGVWYWD